MITASTYGFARRALLIGGIVVSAIALAFGIGTAYAADQRLADADNALQKARALLEASETGGTVSDKAQKQFDRAAARAIANVDRAREQILNAQNAVDNP